MELRQLQYFIKVARKQHVTQASEELHVAQSAVSRQIHMLEEELGIQLFIQKGRNVHLTSAGKLFLTRIDKILNDLDQAVQEIHEFLNPDAGEIRVGFPHSLGINLLPTMVAEFRKEHPNVKFKLKQGTYHSLIHDVIEGEIDLAFISPCPEEHDDLTGGILMTEELYVILPPNHKLAKYKSIRLEQLRDEDFVMFSNGYSLRDIVLEACDQAGFQPKIAFEGEETDTILGLVAAGMGVSLLPEIAFREGSSLQPAKLKIIEPKVSRTIGLIQPAHHKLPLVAKVFHEFLIYYFQKI